MYGTTRTGTANKSGSTYTYSYELSDHLGNVRAVIGRTKNAGKADIKSWQDYFPHGSVMPGRQGISGTAYRNGYQGQYAEKDVETGYDAFDLRMHDSRIGRWLSTDPMGQYWSPYMANGNNPVSTVDPTGGTGGDGSTPSSGASGGLGASGYYDYFANGNSSGGGSYTYSNNTMTSSDVASNVSQLLSNISGFQSAIGTFFAMVGKLPALVGVPKAQCRCVMVGTLSHCF
ncbi:MAG: hypothetical protein H7259_09840 [Cytophagales bacterium]|nr:hypothetical protein [Cytophaga sp.]